MAVLVDEFLLGLAFGAVLLAALMIAASPIIWVMAAFKGRSFCGRGYRVILEIWATIMDGL